MDTNNDINRESNQDFNLEIHDRWSKYYKEFDEKIDNIWNFIMYKDFIDEETKRLNRENKFLKKDIEHLNNTKEDLENIVDELSYENRKLKKKTEKKTGKRKRISSNENKWINNEKRKKPKN